ncbi:MAG: energy-coupling factor transporter transmembrane component T [Nocardioidaceae bacterium]
MPRLAHSLRQPRSLHPGAWWLWALGLAAATSRTNNPLICLLILAVAGFVVMARRSRAPWAYAYGAFLRLGLMIIGVRIVLQALLSSESQGIHVLVVLPQVPLPSWAAGIKLGGLVTWEAVLVAFASGLQLATLICCIGAANALASATRLLRCVPGALYEIGVASVVALTFAPQFVADASRVKAAQRLRGSDAGGLRSLRRTGMPVLEGALSRSVELAAAMDSRGYGRRNDVSVAARRFTTGLVLAGVLGICVGLFGLLDAGTTDWLGSGALVAGSLVAAAGLVAGGRRTARTRYRPDPWALPEWLVAGSGVTCAVLMVVVSRTSPDAAVPPYPLQIPELPLLALLAPLVALLPVLVSPPPPDRLPEP